MTADAEGQELDVPELQKKLARVAGTAHERHKEIQRLKRVIATNGTEIEKLQADLERYSFIKPEDMRTPAWLKPKPGKDKKHRGTPVLMLSDLHLDEVVDLHEMDGMNEYNRAIAEERMYNIIEGTIKLVKNYVAGIEVDGIMVALLGDIITGTIHEELAVTNEAPVPDTIVHWVPVIAAALKRLADEFGKVYVPCVSGNHDRTTFKTPKKQRAQSSYSWIIYNWLADTCRDDDRIQFSITPSPEQIVEVYDTRFLLSHGDSFRSAGGVGGIYPALLKWLLRKHSIYAEVRKPWDIALIGHWHQLRWLEDCYVNGSLKGYDEYAKDGGFAFEKPRQGLFIVTPERGVIQQMAVYAD